jgi:hypothetical protein
MDKPAALNVPHFLALVTNFFVNSVQFGIAAGELRNRGQRFPFPIGATRREGVVMGLAQLIQTVEGRIVDFGQSLCGDRRMRLQEEADFVSEDLHERYAARVRRRADREEAKVYLAGLEIEETLLGSRVEVCVRAKEPAAAWQQALQLERVRQLAKAERDRLHRLEERIEEGDAEILELETRLARLQEKLYS